MEKLQINCPEGYQIDEEKTDLFSGDVYFKKINEVNSYEKIALELFNGKKSFYTDVRGAVELYDNTEYEYSLDPINSTTKIQLESILSLNKLCNVAKYLNSGWIPDWSNPQQEKYHHEILNYNIRVNMNTSVQCSKVYFETKEKAQKAIEILGESEIKKALTLNH